MNEIIIKTNTPQELIDTATSFFEAKKKVEAELEKLNRLENFYKSELNEIRNQFHTTRDGKVIHLSQMEASHLMNTAAMLENALVGPYGKKNNKVNKYTNEIKKRGLATEYFALLDARKVKTAHEADFDDLNEVEDEYNF